MPSTTADLAKSLVERIAATPRFAGSAPENSARDLCRERLAAAGFSVRYEEFTFSQIPARLGPFITGSIFAGGVFLAGHVAGGHQMPIAAIAIAFGAVIVAGLVGMFLSRSILALPLWRAQATNLIATRGDAEPNVWLVAHTDSKSQTIGMLVRVGSIMVTCLLFAVMIAMMALQVLDPADQLRIVQSSIASALVIFAAIPFVMCFVTNSSRGALDNASGVAAVLLAAESLHDRSIGVLLTSAEELALAGVMAFAEKRQPGTAFNCDTIDDSGGFICMTSGKGRRAANALAAGGKRVNQAVSVRGLIPGILTDSVALAQAGWDTCTLSRGNLGTLARVHTSRDEPGRIDGTGIALAAGILAATVEELS